MLQTVAVKNEVAWVLLKTSVAGFSVRDVVFSVPGGHARELVLKQALQRDRTKETLFTSAGAEKTKPNTSA